ncbi:exo-beta-N-acetylmuramidase NamZ family protein [Porphyromonas sp.]
MMTKKTFALLLVGALSWAASAHAQKLPTPVTVGAERMELLLPTLQGKRVALMVNQSSLVGSTGTHLVDTLLSQGINIVRLFVPEHGLRGKVDAGKNVRSGVDEKTGLPVVSLYGQRKRPTPEMLADIDLLVFDLQDVGTRFYTYISSMHYLMEACAEEGKTFVVCDRPNPNDFIDGPILEPDCRSFIGVDPLPVAHGMTVGELALMIDGERWLRGGNTCHVKVIPMDGWSHGDPYELPVRPSPNLPNSRSIELYPSLCFFEATIMSVGRGTSKPFQAIGYPDKRFGSIVYTPQIKLGEDSNPRHKGKLCYGTDYTSVSLPKRQIALGPLLDYYRKADSLGLQLINQRQLFDLLAGTKKLRQQLSSGLSEDEIRASWQAGLKAFQAKRARYLLYTDYR